MDALILVMLGGAVGAGLRYGVGMWAVAQFGAGSGFPWGTLAVNLVGSLLMGLLAGAVAREGAGLPVHWLLGVGLLGGFTTFSAFSLDAAFMIQDGRIALALSYALASVIGAVLLFFAGLALGRLAA